MTARDHAPDPASEDVLIRGPQSDWREHACSLIADLCVRSPRIYWTDFLLSVGFAWAFAAAFFMAAPWSIWQAVSFVASGILFYRAGTFIHEIVHMPASQMIWFKRAWNVLMGIPLLMPWVLYRNHTEHHNHTRFGTPGDGEYLPLASSHSRETVKYLLQAPLLPAFMVIRFGLVSPISWLGGRRVREWVLTAMSAAVSNPYYRKRFPKRDETHLVVVEVACFAYLVALAVLFALGLVSGGLLVKAYVLVAFTLGLNWVRNLAAHRYANDGGQMSLSEQVEDSINIVGQTWLTVLMFPVGLRYHALHHMFPALPYHQMGKAHARLMASIPADSPYRRTNRDSFFQVVVELWRSARGTEPSSSTMKAWSPGSSRS